MARQFSTITEARKHLKDVVDYAEASIPVQLQRGESKFLMTSKDFVIDLLRTSSLVPCPQVIAEDGGWSVILPGTPIATDGLDFNDTVADFVADLRDYATDWITNDEVRRAVNHRGNAPLVHLIDALTDEALRAWVLGEPGVAS